MSYIWVLVLFLALIPLTIEGCIGPKHEIQELERPTNGLINSQPPATPPQFSMKFNNYGRGWNYWGSVPRIEYPMPPTFFPPKPGRPP
ncbi:hypothetical protein TSUD_401450 [Trifolium subterraneum]|uniref:Uncharacterized protein n=1 Tax=Trifolium subterraneum TaxID=3900 RepID=A0A2Z6NR47_TRISU|nr:hypothetical protein TSUD_401450 [Trifolium subterraneum]